MEISTDAVASYNGYELQLLRVLERLFSALRHNKSIFCTIEYLDDVFEMECKDNGEYTIVTEQDKNYEKAFSINSEQVMNSMQIFLDNWLSLGKSCDLEFLFCTNTTIAKEKKLQGFSLMPDKPILSLLIDGEIDAYKYILPTFKNNYNERHKQDKAFIDKFNGINDDEWKKFFSQITWKFSYSSNDIIKTNILQEINELCKSFGLDSRLSNFIYGNAYTEIINRLNKKDFLQRVVHCDTIKVLFYDLLNIVKKDYLEEWNLNWFKTRLNESIENLSSRYSVDLDIEIEQEEILEFLCAGQIKKEYAIRKLNEIRKFFISELEDKHIKLLDEKINKCISLASGEIKETITSELIKETIDDLISWIHDNLPKNQESIVEVFNKKHNLLIELKGDYKNHFFYKDEEECFKVLNKLKIYLILSFQPYALITGKAGIGKSHFLAHCARKYLDSKGLCILILGNILYENRTLSVQIQEKLGISTNHSIDSFFEYLNKYGENTGNRSIIFFDAINEGNNSWKNEILGFLSKIKSYPWIGIILSIRSKSNESLNKSLVSQRYITTIELSGFANNIQAIKSFFKYYNIPFNLYERLRYEFESPLFLKIYCESYKIQQTREANGLKEILNNYFYSINEKISNKYNWNNKINIVKKAIDSLIDLILETKTRENDYEAVNKRIDESLGQYHKFDFFIEELISENILSCFKTNNNSNHTYIVYFEYELFGDYLIAERIIEKAKLSEFTCKNQLNDFFSCKNPYYDFIINRRIMEMLAVLIPDTQCKYKDSGFEVFYWPDNYMRYFDDYMFYNSLLWRNGNSMDNISFSYLLNGAYTTYKYDMMYDLFETILKICIVKNHHYNINFLNREFSRFEDKEFKRHWTAFISNDFRKNIVFSNLMFIAENQYASMDVEEKMLLGLTLSWCLVSLDDDVRQKCMSALYGMYVEDLGGLVKLIKFFQKFSLCKVGIIVETLYLVAMHCTYLNEDKDGIKMLCSFIQDKYLNIGFEDYFMVNEYRKYILEFGIEFGYINDINSSRINNQFLGIYSDFRYVNDEEISVLIKRNNVKRDDNNYIQVESSEDEDCFEDYFSCQNNIIFSLMSLYTEVKCEYTNIFFMTERYIDMIAPKYQADFCKNVIKEIFELGYGYITFGFHDHRKSDKNEVKYIAQNYERIAFNLVLQKYTKCINQFSSYYSKAIIDYKGLWMFNGYETFDISINPNGIEADNSKNSENCLSELIKAIEEAIKKNEFVRVFDSTDKRGTYVVKKEEKITLEEIMNCNNRIIEGFYYSELFLSKPFFEYFESMNGNNKLIPIVKEYIWDYEPFACFSIINPIIYKLEGLTISEDKFKYYKFGQQVCFNSILLTDTNEFQIKIDFLNDFLINNNYIIIWYFNNITDNKNMIVKYDGHKINIDEIL